MHTKSSIEKINLPIQSPICSSIWSTIGSSRLDGVVIHNINCFLILWSRHLCSINSRAPSWRWGPFRTCSCRWHCWMTHWATNEMEIFWQLTSIRILHKWIWVSGGILVLWRKFTKPLGGYILKFVVKVRCGNMLPNHSIWYAGITKS